MKRSVLFIFCAMFLCSSVFSQEQKKYNHWSLGIKAGVERPEFSGDNLFKGDAFYGFTIGAELERTFTPLFGMILDYNFMKYDRTKDTDLDGSAHEISILGSVDFTNLLWKYRRGNWQKFHAFARLGAGVSLYDAVTDGSTLVIPVGGVLEYNVTDHLALGITGERRWHTSSTMGLGGHVQDKAVFWSIMGNVRVKFGKNHIRNERLADYEAPFMEDLYKYDDEPLKKSISDNEAAVNNLKDQLNKANAEMNNLNNELNNTKKELEKCCKEAANNVSSTKEDNLIQVENIEFDLGSHVIKSSYNKELDRIAKVMENLPNLKVEIDGHADDTGSDEVNQILSLDRAKAVRNYIVERGIELNRITTVGMGKSKPIADNSTEEGRQKNRRVEFVFSSK